MCNTQYLPWRNIWFADNPIEVLNEHLTLLVGGYASTKGIRGHNMNKPWFDYQYRHVLYFKQVAHLRWTRNRTQVN